MAQEKKVKVFANATTNGSEMQTLWGVQFFNVDDKLIAEISKTDSDAMVNAGRVKLL